MKTLTLNLPANVNMSEKEITLLLATQFYDMGQLSLGQAAEMAGISKQKFMDILGKFDVSIFGESFEDIEKDLTNA